ncbi:MAG: hypothetical protein Q4E01_04980 [Actinomycetaceae bacterium]|nr:hypothetical protein [Actinomycetaceae bacterium]
MADNRRRGGSRPNSKPGSSSRRMPSANNRKSDPARDWDFGSKRPSAGSSRGKSSGGSSKADPWSDWDFSLNPSAIGKRVNPQSGSYRSAPNVSAGSTPGSSRRGGASSAKSGAKAGGRRPSGGKSSGNRPSSKSRAGSGSGRGGSGRSSAPAKAAKPAKARKSGGTSGKHAPTPRWARVLIVVLLIAALGLGGYWLATTALSSMRERQAALESVQDSEITPPIAECKPSDLEFSVTGYDQSITVGSGWNASVTVTNRGKEACLTDGSGKSLGVLVTSGTYELVDTMKCASKDESLPLLLGVGKSWNGTVSWDGKDYQQCTAGSAGKAGTYVVHVKYFDQVPADLVVQVVEKTD